MYTYSLMHIPCKKVYFFVVRPLFPSLPPPILILQTNTGKSEISLIATMQEFTTIKPEKFTMILYYSWNTLVRLPEMINS